MTDLRWISSTSASALAAAAALVRERPPTNARLATALAAPALELVKTLQGAGIALEPFFDHIVPLAAGIENYRELAGLSARRAAGQRPSEELVSRLAAAIAALENALRRELPGAADELQLRSGPLCEQWQARGPGLLAAIGRATAAELIVERADVLLVHAISGGGGRAYLPYNSVSIEAVLANPHAELPEVVRLGWLISTLNFDRPEFSEEIAPARLGMLARLAIVPAALEAADYVELTQNTPALLERGLTAWGLAKTDPPGPAEALAATVASWWSTFHETPTSWSVALRALDQMLAAIGM